MGKLNATVMERGVVLDENYYEWKISKLLYMDDTFLMAHMVERQRRMVNVSGKICWRRKLRVNVFKNKVMVVSKKVGYDVNMHLNGGKWNKLSVFGIWVQIHMKMEE